MNTHLDFVALQTRDLEQARLYFTQVLNFEIRQEVPGAYVFAAAGGADVAIRRPLPGVDTTHPFGVGVSLWLSVPDADAYHAQLAGAGADIVQPLQDGPFGRMFSVLTPDPATLETLAEEMGVTRERVRQIQQEALVKLKRAMAARGVVRDSLL